MYAVTQWPSWDADSVSAASACRPESIGQRCVNGASTRKLALTRTRLVPDARSSPRFLNRKLITRTRLGSTSEMGALAGLARETKTYGNYASCARTLGRGLYESV